jgi:cobalt-zinc-cadmium efflux system protein
VEVVANVGDAERASLAGRRTRRLAAALGLCLLIAAGQVVAGVLGDSIGLLSDAGHNLVDAAALVLAVIAAWLARRPPTAQRSFGLHRASILAALGSSALIAMATIVLVVESARRLAHPEPVAGSLVLAVAAGAALVNGLSAALLRGDVGDLNARAAALHLVGDGAASAAVAVAGLVILVTGRWYRLDPIASLVVAGFIAWQAWRLLRESIDVLLEAAPRDIDVSDVAAAVTAVRGVEAVHDLHVWSLTTELPALSAHVVLAGHPTLEQAQGVGERAKQMLGARFAIAHATLELECEQCAPADPCALDDLPPLDAYAPPTPGPAGTS